MVSLTFENEVFLVRTAFRSEGVTARFPQTLRPSRREYPQDRLIENVLDEGFVHFARGEVAAEVRPSQTAQS